MWASLCCGKPKANICLGDLFRSIHQQNAEQIVPFCVSICTFQKKSVILQTNRWQAIVWGFSFFGNRAFFLFEALYAHRSFDSFSYAPIAIAHRASFVLVCLLAHYLSCAKTVSAQLYVSAFKIGCFVYRHSFSSLCSSTEW